MNDTTEFVVTGNRNPRTHDEEIVDGQVSTDLLLMPKKNSEDSDGTKLDDYATVPVSSDRALNLSSKL